MNANSIGYIMTLTLENRLCLRGNLIADQVNQMAADSETREAHATDLDEIH